MYTSFNLSSVVLGVPLTWDSGSRLGEETGLNEDKVPSREGVKMMSIVSPNLNVQTKKNKGKRKWKRVVNRCTARKWNGIK